MKQYGQSKRPQSKTKVHQCINIILGAFSDKKGVNFQSFVFLRAKMVCSISFKTKNA